MRRIRDLLIAALVLLVGKIVPARRPRPPRERIVPPGPKAPRAELLAMALLLLGALCAVAFVAAYALDRLSSQTQWMGLTLGLAFVLIGAAGIVVAKGLIVTEELSDAYSPEEHPDEQDAIVAILEESESRLTRRRLFRLTLGFAGGALGVALLAPLASLGPVLDLERFTQTGWRRGRRLVDEHGRAYRAADIEEGTMYTAFPEGADREAIGSPIVLVRLPREELRLPPENAGYDADGIVAYSKICTHAGCAVSLYRTPLFRPTDPPPALVCPCHYSTFDPADGGTVTYGPAGRKLPMLPLSVDGSGDLRARGNFDGPVGPSWWGVRSRQATSGRAR
jgi:ubiquinol-cytochrome c reductase iron-sulfur subunit